jgi:hypothetical protein
MRLTTRGRACTARLPSVKKVVDVTKLGPKPRVTWSSAKTAAVGPQTVRAAVSYPLTGRTDSVLCPVQIVDSQKPVMKSVTRAKSGALPEYCGYPVGAAGGARACFAPFKLFTLADNCLSAGVTTNYTCTVTGGGVDSDCVVEYKEGGVDVLQVRLLSGLQGRKRGWLRGVPRSAAGVVWSVAAAARNQPDRASTRFTPAPPHPNPCPPGLPVIPRRRFRRPHRQPSDQGD